MELKKLIQKRWTSSASQYGKLVRDQLDNEGGSWLKYMNKHFQPEPGAKILETCCGPGFLSILLSGDGRIVVGVDESEAMLSEAAKNAESRNADVSFMQMDCHSLEFADESFDFVVTRNSLWTLYNPAGAYKEWIRVLKPGGKMIVFDSAWGHEYHCPGAMEKKKSLRKNNGLPVTDGEVFFGDAGLAQELAVRTILGKHERPDWDFNVLCKNKMEIEIDDRAWESIWSEETKKYYSYAPMFMIKAVK